MCPDLWGVEEMGPGVWLATLYLRRGEGKLSHAELGNGSEDLWGNAEGNQSRILVPKSHWGLYGASMDISF